MKVVRSKVKRNVKGPKDQSLILREIKDWMEQIRVKSWESWMKVLECQIYDKIVLILLNNVNKEVCKCDKNMIDYIIDSNNTRFKF